MFETNCVRTAILLFVCIAADLVKARIRICAIFLYSIAPVCITVIDFFFTSYLLAWENTFFFFLAIREIIHNANAEERPYLFIYRRENNHESEFLTSSQVYKINELEYVLCVIIEAILLFIGGIVRADRYTHIITKDFLARELLWLNVEQSNDLYLNFRKRI